VAGVARIPGTQPVFDFDSEYAVRMSLDLRVVGCLGVRSRWLAGGCLFGPPARQNEFRLGDLDLLGEAALVEF
jgi:hypothetical protein